MNLLLLFFLQKNHEFPHVVFFLTTHFSVNKGEEKEAQMNYILTLFCSKKIS